jgi:hypothetical protein
LHADDVDEDVPKIPVVPSTSPRVERTEDAVKKEVPPIVTTTKKSSQVVEKKTEDEVKAGLGAAALAAGVTLWGAPFAAVAVAANLVSSRNDTAGKTVAAAGVFVTKVRRSEMFLR